VKKRYQLATKTMGKKTFTKRNKEGGQFMAQKKTRTEREVMTVSSGLILPFSFGLWLR
jgi:hypothetical protein